MVQLMVPARWPQVSAELVIGTLVAVLAWAVPMTWQIRLGLLFIAAVLVVDLVRRVKYSWIVKALITATTFATLACTIIPAVLDDYRATAIFKTGNPEGSKPITFRQLFDRDFAGLGSFGREINIRDGCHMHGINVPVRLLIDNVGRTTSLAVFIENTKNNDDVLKAFLKDSTKLLGMMSENGMRINIPGDTATYDSKEFKFSNVIYFYTKEDVPDQIRAVSELQYLQKGITIIFRGYSYYVINWHRPIVSKIYRFP